MKTQQYDSYEAVCAEICSDICARLKKEPKMCLCIAAGHTSLGVLRGLKAAVQAGQADFSDAVFIAMDEWLHMNQNTPESCGTLLCKELLDEVKFRKVRLIDGLSENMDEECAAIERFLKEETQHGVLDYLVLGCGMNGHLGLNEPGTPLNSRTHVTKLDPVTQSVGQKYFSQKTELTGGVTMGLENFVQARRSVLPICGAHKKEILDRLLQCKEPTETLPASAMLAAEDCTLYYDTAAARGEG